MTFEAGWNAAIEKAAKRFWKWMQRPLCQHDMVETGPEFGTGDYVGKMEAVFRKRVCGFGCGHTDEIQIGWSKDNGR